MKRIIQKGFGKELPPNKIHVIAWFIQKGSSEINALAFYKHYNSLKWENGKGAIIKDWKVHAWAWIWTKQHNCSHKSSR